MGGVDRLVFAQVRHVYFTKGHHVVRPLSRHGVVATNRLHRRVGFHAPQFFTRFVERHEVRHDATLTIFFFLISLRLF